jgi:hypothetical protein
LIAHGPPQPPRRTKRLAAAHGQTTGF